MTNKIIDGVFGVPTYENGCLTSGGARNFLVFENGCIVGGGGSVGYILERPNIQKTTVFALNLGVEQDKHEDQEFTIDQSYEGVEFASGEIFSVPSTSTTSIEIDLPANFYVSEVIIKHINDPEPTA
jgi:hypothetical protein